MPQSAPFVDALKSLARKGFFDAAETIPAVSAITIEESSSSDGESIRSSSTIDSETNVVSLLEFARGAGLLQVVDAIDESRETIQIEAVEVRAPSGDTQAEYFAPIVVDTFEVPTPIVAESGTASSASSASDDDMSAPSSCLAEPVAGGRRSVNERVTVATKLTGGLESEHSEPEQSNSIASEWRYHPNEPQWERTPPYSDDRQGPGIAALDNVASLLARASRNEYGDSLDDADDHEIALFIRDDATELQDEHNELTDSGESHASESTFIFTDELQHGSDVDNIDYDESQDGESCEMVIQFESLDGVDAESADSELPRTSAEDSERFDEFETATPEHKIEDAAEDDLDDLFPRRENQTMVISELFTAQQLFETPDPTLSVDSAQIEADELVLATPSRTLDMSAPTRGPGHDDVEIACDEDLELADPSEASMDDDLHGTSKAQIDDCEPLHDARPAEALRGANDNDASLSEPSNVIADIPDDEDPLRQSDAEDSVQDAAMTDEVPFAQELPWKPAPITARADQTLVMTPDGKFPWEAESSADAPAEGAGTDQSESLGSVGDLENNDSPNHDSGDHDSGKHDSHISDSGISNTAHDDTGIAGDDEIRPGYQIASNHLTNRDIEELVTDETLAIQQDELDWGINLVPEDSLDEHPFPGIDLSQSAELAAATAELATSAPGVPGLTAASLTESSVASANGERPSHELVAQLLRQVLGHGPAAETTAAEPEPICEVDRLTSHYRPVIQTWATIAADTPTDVPADAATAVPADTAGDSETNRITKYAVTSTVAVEAIPHEASVQPTEDQPDTSQSDHGVTVANQESNGTSRSLAFPTPYEISLAHQILKTEFGTKIRELSKAIHEQAPQGSVVVQLVSAGESSQRSRLVAGLGMYLQSQNPRPTLIVDAEPVSQELSRNFVQFGAGLSEALLNGVAWNSCVRQTASEKLSVLPAGADPTLAQSPLEAQLQSQLSAILQEWRDAYGIILIDGGAADSSLAQFLSSSADMTLVCVQLGRTSRSELQDACDQIKRAGGTITGCVTTTDGNDE